MNIPHEGKMVILAELAAGDVLTPKDVAAITYAINFMRLGGDLVRRARDVEMRMKE